MDTQNIREVTEIIDPEQKSAICNAILRALPDWFGMETPIVDYTCQVRSMPFYTVYSDGRPVGFITVKRHTSSAAEVYVMGILEEYHRQGIGAALMEYAEKYCTANGIPYLTVKTLDSSALSEPYERTRAFYSGMGFVPLEVFPLLWDEENPCLFLAKHLECCHVN